MQDECCGHDTIDTILLFCSHGAMTLGALSAEKAVPGGEMRRAATPGLIGRPPSSMHRVGEKLDAGSTPE
jgi:hypothetical protein